MTRFTPLWVQQGNYAASVDRGLINAIWPRQSYVIDMKAVPATAMTTRVGQGKASVWINVISSVLCYSNGFEDVLHTAAHATLPRIDLVVLQVRANDLDGGANNDWLFQVVPGTPAASPVAPALPTYSMPIAEVLIPAAFNAVIPAGNITDTRPRRMDQPLNTAWGEVAYAEQTVAQTAIGSTAVDVTGLSVTWDSPANRRYAMTAFVANASQLTANGQQNFQITDEANALKANAYVAATYTVPNSYTAVVMRRFIQTTAATLTRKLRASTSLGTMNLNFGANVPGWIRIDDIGPAPGTPGTLFDELSDRMEADMHTPTEPDAPEPEGDAPEPDEPTE